MVGNLNLTEQIDFRASIEKHEAVPLSTTVEEREKTRGISLHEPVMFHLPLIVLVLAHVVPAMYLALQRWGWIKHRQET